MAVAGVAASLLLLPPLLLPAAAGGGGSGFACSSASNSGEAADFGAAAAVGSLSPLAPLVVFPAFGAAPLPEEAAIAASILACSLASANCSSNI